MRITRNGVCIRLSVKKPGACSVQTSKGGSFKTPNRRWKWRNTSCKTHQTMSRRFKVKSLVTEKETEMSEEQVAALKSGERYVPGRFQITEIQPATMPKEVAAALKTDKP